MGPGDPARRLLGVRPLRPARDRHAAALGRWATVAPTRPAAPGDPADPAYRWPADVDRAAAEAARRRHPRQPARRAARRPGPTAGARRPGAPTARSDFADFLTAAARRYPAVRRWMIWGEPNRADRFQPNARNSALGPRAYATLLDAAYAALKRAGRQNIVIGANTWTGGTVKPPDFLRWMRLPDGRPPRLDWLGHNPFPFRFPKLADPPLRGRLSRHQRRRHDERRGAAHLRPPRSRCGCRSTRSSPTAARAVFATFVSRAAQARYLTAGYRARRRARPRRRRHRLAGRCSTSRRRRTARTSG